MKIQVGVTKGTYSFSVSNRQVTVSGVGTPTLEQFILIVNETTGKTLYNFAVSTLKATLSGSILTLNASADLTGANDTDKLTVLMNVPDGQQLMANSIPVTIASDQSVLSILSTVGASGGASTVSSSALEASRVIKNSAGTLISLVGYNSKSSSQFIQIHNTTAVPADAAVPIYSFSVLPTANFSLDVPVFGIPFTTGICVCNSSTAPTKTVGSADCFFTAVIK